MAHLEVTFLEQTLSNPFLLEIPPLLTLNEIPFAEKYGGIIISPFPYEIKDRIIDNSSLAEKYLENIGYWRKSTDKPIIAGIDGVVGQPVEEYCSRIEEAGADALHLRLLLFPDDRDFRSADYEKIFLESVAKVSYSIRIPLVITLPVFFTNLFGIVEQLFYRGIQGFCPDSGHCVTDIDIEQLEYLPDHVCDMKVNTRFYLKWISYFSAYFPRAHFAVRLGQSLDYDDPIKFLLAGAHVIIEKTTSNQSAHIEAMTDYLVQWMEKNSFEKIEHFQGQLNFQPIMSPSAYERKCFIDRYLSLFIDATSQSGE